MKRRVLSEEVILSAFVLLFTGIGPNIFPAAQAGTAKMSVMAVWLLIPSVILIGIVTIVAGLRGHRRLTNRTLAGVAAGFIATFGLEAVRANSFHVFEGMPGDLPRLMGVLITDRFMDGPSPLSDTLGLAYHLWNGMCFGVIFFVVFGRRSILWAIVFAQVLGIGFLLGPAVKALGVGFMGVEMPSMPVTIVAAHLMFGLILGVLGRAWIRDDGWLLGTASSRTAG